MINVDKIGYNEQLMNYVHRSDIGEKIDKLNYITETIIYYQYNTDDNSINLNFMDDRNNNGYRYCGYLEILKIYHIIIYNKNIYIICKCNANYSYFSSLDIKIHIISITNDNMFYGYETFGDNIWLYYDNNILKYDKNSCNKYVINTNIFLQKKNRLLDYAGKLNLAADNTILI